MDANDGGSLARSRRHCRHADREATPPILADTARQPVDVAVVRVIYPWGFHLPVDSTWSQRRRHQNAFKLLELAQRTCIILTLDAMYGGFDAIRS